MAGEKIFDIDCMKYRKSTHLASVDVDALIAERGNCELTIKSAFYEKGVDVNGRKTDGYFIKFEDVDIKNMLVNSGNRKKISNIVKELRNCTAVESRNLKNWVGIKIRLKVDPNIEFNREVVGGIVVDTSFKATPPKTLQQAKAAFEKVNSRETFESTMIEFSEFMQNAEIINTCKDIAVKYPKK